MSLGSPGEQVAPMTVEAGRAFPHHEAKTDPLFFNPQAKSILPGRGRDNLPLPQGTVGNLPARDTGRDPAGEGEAPHPYSWGEQEIALGQ